MNMINLTIDGVKVTVPQGSTVLEAAKSARDIYSHPLLSQGYQRDRRLPHVLSGD